MNGRRRDRNGVLYGFAKAEISTFEMVKNGPRVKYSNMGL